MTYINAHTQQHISQELKLKLNDAYKRIRMLEKECQDKQVLILNLQEQLHLKQLRGNGKA